LKRSPALTSTASCPAHAQALQQVERRVDEVPADRLQFTVGEIAFGDAPTPRCHGSGQSVRCIADLAVEAGPVGVRSLVREPLAERSLRIVATAQRHADEPLVRDADRFEVDDTAAEFAGELRRISLLHQRAGEDVAGEEIERDDALQWLRTGKRRAVQERR
jgi:hypothetical protein